jgi:hypothetical protein
MKSKTKNRVSLLVFIYAVSAFSQLNFVEKAEFVGIQINEINLPTEKIKKTDISFIFNGKPKNYFYNLNEAERELNIDIFDAIKGEDRLPEIGSAPFKTSRIEYLKIDQNRDIEGLEPDIRDVVRIVIKLEDDVFVDCGVTDDYNVVTLKTRWSLEPIRSVQNKPKYNNWKIITGVILGTAITAVTLIDQPPPPPPPPIEWTSPPAMPSF